MRPIASGVPAGVLVDAVLLCIAADIKKFAQFCTCWVCWLLGLPWAGGETGCLIGAAKGALGLRQSGQGFAQDKLRGGHDQILLLHYSNP